MSEILDGKALAKKVRKELKIEVESLKEKHIYPTLAVIMVGDDSGSQVYVRNKSRACEKAGIEFEEYLYDADITEQELLETIDVLNKDKNIHGILLQSPVPNLCIGEDCFISCTPYGIIKLLEEYNIETEGKEAVILGRSNIVGKPMIQCLLNKNCTVTVCHSKTKDIDKVISKADIVISAIGKPKFVKKEMVKPGATVIDVGINRLEDGTIVGDVDYEEVSKVAGYITPVPGGVGPMTIAMLLNNVVKATKDINKQ